MNTKILIIDDDVELSNRLRDLLKIKDYEAVVKNNPQEGVSLVKEGGIDLVMLDLKMPSIDGIDILKAIKEFDPLITVVILTGYPSTESINKAFVYGASDYLVKPFDSQKLYLLIEYWLEKKKNKTIKS